MSRTFEITRADGRSNTQVILDLVRDAEPGEVFSYDQISSALATGSKKTYTLVSVRGIVLQAFERLLKEQQRTLTNVRGIGYRVAFAREHRQIAVIRTKRADVQFRRGYQTLSHVDFKAMTENERRAHEGTLMIVGAIYQQQHAMEKRLKAVEDAIRGLGVAK